MTIKSVMKSEMANPFSSASVSKHLVFSIATDVHQALKLSRQAKRRASQKAIIQTTINAITMEVTVLKLAVAFPLQNRRR